ncbi:helix-turn-helix domain-containing protein [Pseudomonas sp. NPDC086566]|uniref:helix-turn-helix domain-containing protein n=1 Tax=Pseudomonas sp. NPDC086566 TaxID=3390647 RepID=UPI003D00B98C
MKPGGRDLITSDPASIQVQFQEAFADRCGLARTYMSRIETGGANPSINAIKVLADALGVSISDLFEGL